MDTNHFLHFLLRAIRIAIENEEKRNETIPAKISEIALVLSQNVNFNKTMDSFFFVSVSSSICFLGEMQK